MVAALLLFTLVNSSFAGIIYNDNSIVDEATGLEWLDLPLTAGRSVNQVLNQDGWITQGFRYASTAEVAILFNSAGLISPTSTPWGDYWLPAQDALLTLLDNFGCTRLCGTNGALMQGLTIPAENHGSDYETAYIIRVSDQALNSVRLGFDVFMTPPVGFYGEVGHFLVRSASNAPIVLPDPNTPSVPEPETFSLLITSLFVYRVIRPRIVRQHNHETASTQKQKGGTK